MNELINVLAHALKVVVYFIVGDSQHGYIISLQKGISFGVVRKSVLIKMLGPVQFDHQLSLRTVEIRDVFSRNFLPGKANRIVPQKIIP